MASHIVSEGGHYYIMSATDLEPAWSNLLEYVDSVSMSDPDMESTFIDALDGTLMSEFNCKWVRNKKKNYLKFYSAKELEYFLLRFA